jgi:hypothetical protein
MIDIREWNESNTGAQCFLLVCAFSDILAGLGRGFLRGIGQFQPQRVSWSWLLLRIVDVTVLRQRHKREDRIAFN